MKKISTITLLFVLVILAAACTSSKGSYKVVPLSKNADGVDVRSGIVYTLPRTVLNFEVHLKKQEFEKGIYADYAEKLLGVKAYSNERKTIYTLMDVKFSTSAEPDTEQYYFISPKSGGAGLSVMLSPEGFLQSVNYKSVANTDTDKKEHNRVGGKLSSIEKYILDNNLLLPPPQDEEEFIVKKRYEKDSLIEEIVPVKPVPFSDKPLEAQAKEAAKFIKDIQEKKIHLISGEYEDQYSPNAVEFLYRKLENMEKQYMELFTGTFKVSTPTYYFSVVPQRSQLSNGEVTIPVFGFSENEGIVPLDSPSKTNLFAVSLHSQNTLRVLNNNLNAQAQEKDASNKSLDGFFYRIPESVSVYYTVGYEERIEHAQINQFGTIMNLPTQNLRILFDTETGNVLEYRKLK